MAEYAQMIGGGAGAAGAWMQGTQQGDALTQSAQIQRQNAATALQAGQANADRQELIAGQHMGSEVAAFGASGVTATSGSVLNVMAASHAGAELDRLNILHGADIRAINYQNQASMDTIGAQSAYTGRYLNAFASILGAGSKAYSYSLGAAPSYTAGGEDQTSPYGSGIDVQTPSSYSSTPRGQPGYNDNGGYGLADPFSAEGGA